MRAQTRHELKQDRFSRATIDVAEKTVHWSVEHRGKLLIAGIVVAVVLGLGLGGWYYLSLKDQEASLEFSRAVRTLDTPVRPPNMPPQPDSPSFSSFQERATTAHKQFQEIIDRYPHTHAANFAHYFLGLTSAYMGDNAGAERELKAVASYRNADLSTLAKFALASVYRNTNRDPAAIALYKEIIAKPTSTVGKVMAQMELAATYETANQPLEAKRTYEEVRKENPSSQAAQMATAKLQALK